MLVHSDFEKFDMMVFRFGTVQFMDPVDNCHNNPVVPAHFYLTLTNCMMVHEALPYGRISKM
jgi:hypothetical protein